MPVISLRTTPASPAASVPDAVRTRLLRYGIDLEPGKFSDRLVVYDRPVCTNWCESLTDLVDNANSEVHHEQIACSQNPGAGVP